MGASLARRARSDFVISTKVGRLLVPNPSPSGSDLSTGGFDVPDDLARSLDYLERRRTAKHRGELERLRLDHIDVAYVRPRR